MFAAWILVRDVALCAFALVGLAAPWLPLLHRWTPPERLTLAVAAGLLTGHLAAFAVFMAGVPLHWFWLAPCLGGTLAWRLRDHLRDLWGQHEARAALAALGIVTLWTLGWQSTVALYAGGTWQIDWWEHYDRAHFFLSRWPLDWQFGIVYPLTARPPLVNLWSAALLSGSGGAFYNHQVFMTLLGVIVVLPLWTLARSWGMRDARWLAIALMASPLFVQNATFPWTKLTAAFFVLVALQQLLQVKPDGVPRLVAAMVALAGGMLAHYSAGPWIAALVLAGLATQFGRLREASVRRELVSGAWIAGMVVSVWLIWAIAHYGFVATFTHNTTLALGPESSLVTRIANAATNLWHTLVPWPASADARALLNQADVIGRWRDEWFMLFQLKLPLAFGLTGGALLLVTLCRRPVWATPFTGLTLMLVLVLGTATHSQPDRFGLTHIALQPLVLLGLAWLAAHAGTLPRWMRITWITGMAFDLAGIGLHFGVQSGWVEQLQRGPLPVADRWQHFTEFTRAGYEWKQHLDLVFLGDRGGDLMGGLLLIAAVMLVVRQRPAACGDGRNRTAGE